MSGAPLKIAATWEGRNIELLDRVLPIIDCLEVTTDGMETIVGGQRVLHPSIADLERAAEKVDILFHGVGLSICSHEGMYQGSLDLLDQLVPRVKPKWHSEHLGYARVDGEFVGTMLRPPLTTEMLDILCDRVDYLHERYPIPFLLEHIVGILPDPPGDYDLAGFLNELTRRTGCGLILDVYNLQCDAYNHGFDIDGFLDDLDTSPIREIHTALGQMFGGMMLDAHSLPLREDTIALARAVIPRCPNVEVITYEILASAVHVIGIDAVAGEVVKLRKLFGSQSWSSETCNASSTA